MDAKDVAFKDAKHFQCRATIPTTSDELPPRIYFSAAVRVGGIVVIMGRHHPEWPNTRVIFYSTKQNSLKVVHSNGVNTHGGESTAPVLGLVGDQVFFLDSTMPVVRCFDLVLRDWIPLDVKGITADVDSCARCFMESINSFIYWDLTKGPAVSVLDLEGLMWREQSTKGEVPIYRDTAPLTCCQGSTMYLACEDNALQTVLYLLSSIETGFHWSKPKVRGECPVFAEGASLTYSFGRLFRFGGLGVRTNPLKIYSIDKAEWNEVTEESTSSEYSLHAMRGTKPRAGAHSAVAVRDKLIIFGGLYVLFKKCRFLEARPMQ